jgi:hypothetical protein
MPRLIFKSRAYQLAAEPESELKIQLSGRRGETSQKTRCGLIGWASLMAMASSIFHHAATPFSIVSRQALSFQIRDQQFQCLAAIADQIDLGGKSEPRGL